VSRSTYNDTEQMRFSLIGPAFLCPRDLHQYLPIFTTKKQLATQERGASNSKDTAQDACPLVAARLTRTAPMAERLADACIEDSSGFE
jgi:hypothetical protein